MISRPKTENELATLEDDELIAYAVDARNSDRQDDFRSAVGVFISRRIGLVTFWVGKKADGDEADEIAGKVFVSIFEGAGRIKGSRPGEIVEWMRTVTARRIADHYRSKEKQPDISSLDGQPGDENEWSKPVGDPDSTGGVELGMVIEEALRQLDEVKREVVELRIDGYSSKEVAEASRDDDMTPANVDKIFSRFRRTLAGELDF